MSYRCIDETDVRLLTPAMATHHAKTRKRSERIGVWELQREWLAIHKDLTVRLTALEAERLRLETRTVELAKQASLWQQVVSCTQHVRGLFIEATQGE